MRQAGPATLVSDALRAVIPPCRVGQATRSSDFGNYSAILHEPLSAKHLRGWILSEVFPRTAIMGLMQGFRTTPSPRPPATIEEPASLQVARNSGEEEVSQGQVRNETEMQTDLTVHG